MLVYKYGWRVTDIDDFRDDTVQIGNEEGVQSQFQQAIGQILCHVHWFPAQNHERQGHEYDWPASERRNQATALHRRFCYKYTKSNRGTAYNWWIALHGYARGAWGGTNENTLAAAAMTPQTTLNLEWLRERWAADKHDGHELGDEDAHRSSDCPTCPSSKRLCQPKYVGAHKRLLCLDIHLSKVRRNTRCNLWCGISISDFIEDLAPPRLK